MFLETIEKKQRKLMREKGYDVEETKPNLRVVEQASPTREKVVRERSTVPTKNVAPVPVPAPARTTPRSGAPAQVRVDSTEPAKPTKPTKPTKTCGVALPLSIHRVLAARAKANKSTIKIEALRAIVAGLQSASSAA